MSGLNSFEYHVLASLSESPIGALPMSELATMAQGSRSRLSHAVARLEQAGWVRRRSCDEDKRGTWAELTEAGFAALAAAAPGHVTAVRELLFDVLTPEQIKSLGEISKAVGEKLNAQGGDYCPTEQSTC